MDDFVLVAKALGDETRVRILKMLQRGELCVCHLTEGLGLAQSTVSKHLGVLRRAGLAASRREGHWVYYRLQTEARNAYAPRFLDLLRDALDDDPQVVLDRAKQRDAALCCRETT
jgi:DNA-binding transcriptional ArsR family regulator